jgi:hypothetical protein
MITFLNLGKYGDIGNQLFQYATLISLGKDFNYKVKIPKISSYFYKDYQRIVYYIDLGFNLKCDFLIEEDIKKITNNYERQNFLYSPILNLPDNTNIGGYFQSEKFFIHNKEYILNNLQFKNSIIKEALNKYSLELIRESCFLHIRRGDFVHKPQFHTNLNIDYYTNAINILKPTHISIFSDDIEWCKQNFKFLDQNYVSYIYNTNPFIDLYLMTQAQNCVIANSSFSWWGAWLNRNYNKKVIAPKNWFGPLNSHFSSQDIYAEGWIVI